MYIQSDIENCEGWLSPGGHSSGGRALTVLSQRPLVQSQVAAGFSQFSKNIAKPFHHVHDGNEYFSKLLVCTHIYIFLSV